MSFSRRANHDISKLTKQGQDNLDWAIDEKIKEDLLARRHRDELLAALNGTLAYKDKSFWVEQIGEVKYTKCSHLEIFEYEGVQYRRDDFKKLLMGGS